jgi:hypothetical protein
MERQAQAMTKCAGRVKTSGRWYQMVPPVMFTDLAATTWRVSSQPDHAALSRAT